MVSLGRGLRKAGHEVVYAVKPSFAEYYDLVSAGECCQILPRFRGLALRDVKAFNCHAASADLVLTHDSTSRHLAILAKVLGLRPPLWFMRHCLSGTTRFGGVQLHRLLVNRQIVVSEVVRQSLIATGYPASRTSRVYAGVDLSPFRNPDPAQVARRRAELLGDLPCGAVVIGIVARMNVGSDWRVGGPNGKGYDVLFRALAKVRFQFRVLAFGPDKPEVFAALRQMAAFHGIRPDAVCFPGFVRDLPSCLPLLTINVLPSRAEGLGLAVIEGMAAGIVTIGSRGGGMVEIIEPETTGLLIDEGDVAGLASCLNRLVADPERRRTLASRGQTAVFQRFDASVMTEAFEDVLRQHLPPRR